MAATLAAIGHRTSASSAGGGIRVDVMFPRFMLAGTPVPLTLTVEGLDEGETFQWTPCPSVLTRTDFQNWYPNPDAETAGPEGPVYEFATTGGRAQVRLDARSQPNLGPGVAHCSMTVTTGASTVAVDFNVLVLP